MIPRLRFGSALSFFRSTASSHTLRPGLAQLRRRLVFARSGELLGGTLRASGFAVAGMQMKASCFAKSWRCDRRGLYRWLPPDPQVEKRRYKEEGGGGKYGDGIEV